MGFFDPISDLLNPLYSVFEQIISFIKDLSILIFNNVKFAIRLIPSLIELLGILKDLFLQLLELFNKYNGVVLTTVLLAPLYVSLYYLGTTINILI